MQEITNFVSREAAGEVLAQEIEKLNLNRPYLLAIPRGGIQVAEAIADRLKIPINALVVKKLPAPLNPEYGFGAVTEDGTKMLNEEALRYLNLSDKSIDSIAQKVVLQIQHRKEAFGGLEDEKIHSSDVIIVDDGIATGYSLIAGIKTVEKRNPNSIIVAVPVSSENAYRTIKDMADTVICPVVSSDYFFAVASFYKVWYDLPEDEIVNIIETYREKYS